MCLISKTTRQEMIKEYAPELWKEFIKLDIAMEKAKEEFKKKYGLFWRLRINRKQLEEKQMKIYAKMVFGKFIK